MSRNLILGSSHALSLAGAVGACHATWQEASADLVPIESARGSDTQLLFTTNKPGFMELKGDVQGRVTPRFGPLMDKVRAYDRLDATVVFAIGGNEHNIRFLCSDPRPFDFHHAAVPGIDPSRQVLPAREVRLMLTGLLARTMSVTRLLAAELPRARRFYLPPPPPIPSEDHIRKTPEIFDFARTGVEDARVRLKLYRLYLEILEPFCAEQGLVFLAPPPEKLDAAGFLAEPYWNGSTHATAAYYDGLVSELRL